MAYNSHMSDGNGHRDHRLSKMCTADTVREEWNKSIHLKPVVYASWLFYWQVRMMSHSKEQYVTFTNSVQPSHDAHFGRVILIDCVRLFLVGWTENWSTGLVSQSVFVWILFFSCQVCVCVRGVWGGTTKSFMWKYSPNYCNTIIIRLFYSLIA